MVKNKPEYKGIQKKLVAAVAMVLVASIMVVTSSYAWFTLSTAPEVTGINTSVGSNGNLEIALLEGVIDDIGTTNNATAFPDANTFWGNLVDLSDSSYHLDEITLMPAALTATERSKGQTTYAVKTIGEATGYVHKDGTQLVDFDTATAGVQSKTTGEELTAADLEILAANGVVETYIAPTYGWETPGTSNLIKVPTYGADGRINGFNNVSFSSVYDPSVKGFPKTSANTGVRAVGTVSGMSPAELMLHNARQAVSSAKGTAKTGAVNSLTYDAIKIADIAIKKQTGGSFDQTDVKNLRNAEQNLRAIADSLEDAIYKAVIALGVSQGLNLERGNITISDTDITATGLVWKVDGEGGYDYTADKTLLIAAKQSVDSMYEKLDASDTKITALESKTTPTYEELVAAATAMVNPNTILIEGKTIEGHGGKANLINAVLPKVSTGVSVTIVDGIYAEIAEFVGNYNARALMSVDASSMVDGMGVVQAQANIGTSVNKPTEGWYLTETEAWLSTLTAGNVTGAPEIMSDLYAYAIDLAFRTNAAGSNLLLQTEAKNRVSETSGSATQGAGSYMEFTSGHAAFTIEQMAGLMENIRVVFYGNDGVILAVAGLDVGKTNEDQQATIKVGETDMDLYVDALGNWTTTDTGKAVMGQPNFTIVDLEAKTIRASLVLYNFTINDGKVTLGTKMAADKQVITSLTQNVATAISAMVYLDGNNVQNKDVAIGGTSVTGKLNLQFASSAELDPMDYTFSEQLAAPTATINGNTLTITPAADSKATGYKITVNGQTTTVEGTTYEIPADLPAGPYEITIVATGAGYMDSNPVTVTYTK